MPALDRISFRWSFRVQPFRYLPQQVTERMELPCEQAGHCHLSLLAARASVWGGPQQAMGVNRSRPSANHGVPSSLALNTLRGSSLSAENPSQSEWSPHDLRPCHRIAATARSIERATIGRHDPVFVRDDCHMRPFLLIPTNSGPCSSRGSSPRHLRRFSETSSRPEAC